MAQKPVDHTARRLGCHVRGGDGTWSELNVSDATGVHEFAMPCVEAVLTLDGVYEDTDLLPPGPDLPANEPPPPADAPTAL